MYNFLKNNLGKTVKIRTDLLEINLLIQSVRILENNKIVVNECVILNNDFQETKVISDLNLCFCSNTDKSLKYKYECLSLNIK